MRELEYLEVIKNTLADSSLIGDDCAFLKDFNLCITQDTLVEDVHFKLKTTKPFELGQKAINVNLSDLAAAAAVPLYITVSLSLPKDKDIRFVEEFYKGIDTECRKHNVKVAGGDLTGSDKVFISICAIGKKYNNVNVSRTASKAGDVIVTTGTHGDSAGGLKLIEKGRKEPDCLIKKHLVPIARTKESLSIADVAAKAGLKDFAMMDTSDGLGDAVYKLSKGSGLAFDIDFESVPVSRELKRIFPHEYKDLVFWGGEDYELLFTVPESVYIMLDKKRFFKIGQVTNRPFSKKDEEEFEKNSFNHFED